jgi:hypothetical protein
MIKLLLIVVIAVVYTAIQYPSSGVAQLPGQVVAAAASAEQLAAGEQAVREAFERKLSDLQVQGKGTVSKVLPDDENGARHQRFILSLPVGITVLVAHNIDLAPRIPDLKVGDVVAFNGEYEWNSKGGIIHWTHHDPRGQHEAGWLRHNDVIYQ